MSEQTQIDRPAFLVETKSLRDLMTDLRKAELWLMVAAIAAFLASAFFVVKYFVGGDMTPTAWTTEQWMNAFLGLAITAVITAAQAFLYAAGYKGHAAIIATFIVVFFGVFSEISQSMEREDETVKHRSENSPVFQAALGSIQNLSQQAAVPIGSASLAAAQGKLARHETELAMCASKYKSDARIRRCENYERGKIAEAKGDIAAAQATTTASTAATSTALSAAITQAKGLQYDEEQHHAMIRLIKGMLGVTGIWASFLFSVIIIGTFEYAFHFVGSYVSDHKKALMLLGRDAHGNLIKDHRAGNYTTAQTFSGATPRKDYLNWSSNADTTEAPADDSTHTESGLPKKVHDLSHKRFFQLLYTDIRGQILNGEVRPTPRPVTNAVTDIIKKKSEQLGVKPSLMGKPQRQKIAETILMKLELEGVVERNQEGGIGKPKYVLAKRYQERLNRNAQEEAPMGKPETGDDWTPGATEDQQNLPLPPSSDLAEQGVSEGSRLPQTEVVDHPKHPQGKHPSANTPDVAEKDVSPEKAQGAIYAIHEAISNGSIGKYLSKSPKGDTQKVLKAKKIGSNDPERRALIALAMNELKKEGVVMDNPDYTGSKCGKAPWQIAPNAPLFNGRRAA